MMKNTARGQRKEKGSEADRKHLTTAADWSVALSASVLGRLCLSQCSVSHHTLSVLSGQSARVRPEGWRDAPDCL